MDGQDAGERDAKAQSENGARRKAAVQYKGCNRKD